MTQRYLTVTALTRYLKRKLELDPHLQEVWLKGEISNFHHHYRGHMYLTIKDEYTRISAVMFAPDNHSLKFVPEDGMNVLIKGYVSLFERDGQYQLHIKEMQPDGVGALFLAFEQLKEKLGKAGYFDSEYKKPIPKYPAHIGIVTSPTGAAIRDILTTIKRRYPIADVTVIPVAVQGENAADSIAKAIKYVNELNIFDVLIVGRGGGSIEDLWCFNEEKVAKAIFHSTIPVITGIGHETDTTISDFVADLRAPTPTGAAELAVPAYTELKETITHLQKRLAKLTKIYFMQKQEKFQSLKNDYVFHYPKQMLLEKEQYVDQLSEKMMNRFITIHKEKQYAFQHMSKRLSLQHPKRKTYEAVELLTKLQAELKKRSETLLRDKETNLVSMIEKLSILNPLEIMKRGFSVTYSSDGKIIKSTERINNADKVLVKLLDGTLQCKVESVRRDNDE